MKKRFRLIIIAFVISFAVVAALSFYSLRQFSTFGDYSNQIDHTNRVISQLYQIQSNIKNIDVDERGYMLTKDKAYPEALLKTIPLIYPSIEELRELTEKNPAQNRSLILLRGAVALRIASVKNNLAFTDSATSPEISNYYFEGRKSSQEALAYVREMMEREDSILKNNFKNKQYYQHITANTLKYLLTIFGLLTVLLFILVLNELIRRMESQAELEANLVDLKRSHAELEQIAFAASHDLQEPLRKIRIFSDRLTSIHGDDTGETKMITERINVAAGRVQELIEDMVNLVSLINEDEEKELVDLNLIIKKVQSDLAEEIAEKHALVHVEVMPLIKGYERQFLLLFKSLLDNSLKFSRKGVNTYISIRTDRTTGEELMHINKNLSTKMFYRITISDNGVGFDNKYTSKIFQIFQRLHTTEATYPGKGIGLALCQRIMVNHEGHITAHGHEAVGATFKLFFPID
jgi:signal transduction histidine kinase